MQALCAAYDLEHPHRDHNARVTDADVLEYIDAFSVDKPPHHPTSAIHWDLIRTFGEAEGRRLLLHASRRWDAVPLRARDIVFKWWDNDGEPYEPQAWVDEYLAEVIGSWRREKEQRGAELAMVTAKQIALRDAAEAEWIGLNGTATAEQYAKFQRTYRRLMIPFTRKLDPVTIVASLPPGTPLPNSPMPGAVPMLNTQATVADLGAAIVDAFLAAQSGRPAPIAPRIPDAMHQHPLFESINSAIAHLTGIVEAAPKAFRSAGAIDLLAVLAAVHEPTYSAVCTRIRGTGAALPESKLNIAVRRFEGQVSREVRTGAGWATDSKGMPDSANTDNVAVYLRMVGADVRFNDWSKRIEIKSAGSDAFERFQERHFNNLLTTAANGQHNFRPRESVFKRAVAALASETTFDPVLNRIAAAQASWDGKNRLDSWLASAIGVPNDAYLRAVGRSLIGGIVKRARKPGAKHDEVVILTGPQDTLKSTLCRALALNDEWFTDSVAFEGPPQNVIPQLFGKLVVELAELDGMARREVNYIKRFLSAQSDNVTLKYEAYSSDHARRCIFVGSSNEENPLRDATGNRRFLPVRIEQRINVDFVRKNIDRLFGEAATLESTGELFLIPADVLPEARARQEAARAESDFEIYLSSWFAADAGPAYILPADLAVLVKEATGRSVPPNAYGHAMRRLGFVSSRPYVNDVRTRMWVRGAVEGARRYELHRDVKTGRAYPRIMFPVVSTMPPMPVGRI
jgi:predicted P-loop ATPase